ncbi:MAG: hypothetical protein AMS25_11665 [Gemmatimonas sp. SM23_52]|nr:MAG: hypothetical protein AMS25_11665 [Gemmatimonas sp. SM23_52]
MVAFARHQEPCRGALGHELGDRIHHSLQALVALQAAYVGEARHGETLAARIRLEARVVDARVNHPDGRAR